VPQLSTSRLHSVRPQPSAALIVAACRCGKMCPSAPALRPWLQVGGWRAGGQA
jgi:hypothetical protein